MLSHCDGLIRIGHVQQSKNCITESCFENVTGVKHLFSSQIRSCNVCYSVWFQVWSEATPVKSAASHSTQWHSTMHICRAQSTKTSEWIPLMFIYSSFPHQTTYAALAKATCCFLSASQQRTRHATLIIRMLQWAPLLSFCWRQAVRFLSELIPVNKLKDSLLWELTL